MERQNLLFDPMVKQQEGPERLVLMPSNFIQRMVTCWLSFYLPTPIGEPMSGEEIQRIECDL